MWGETEATLQVNAHNQNVYSHRSELKKSTLCENDIDAQCTAMLRGGASARGVA